MNVDFDLSSIILMITIAQGIYLGSVLIFGRNWKHPSTFLGLTLMFFAVGFIYDVLRHTDLLVAYPMLYFLPVKLYYIPAPLAYLFARKLTPNPLSKKDYTWLAPGVAEFILLIILFLLPVDVKANIENPNTNAVLWFSMYRYLWIPFSIVLLIKCYRLINRNRDRFMNFFSGSQDRLMQWAMRSSIFAVLFCCCFLTKLFVDEATYDTYIFPVNAILIMALTFGVGTWGIKQSFVDFDYDELIEYIPDAVSSEEENQEKEETSGMLVLETLRMYIEKKKPYRDPELTLDILSKSSKIPARQISSSINRFADMNFNTFINQFRVDEAKRMLHDEQYNHLSILGIGFEVGFNSKATFYSVFKKLTGMTPAKWQKHIN